MTEPGRPVPVHLLELPVPLAARSRQWFDELLREFALISAGATDGHDGPHVPRRLMHMVDDLTTRFGGASDEPQERLDAATARGDSVIPDHLLELPTEAAPAIVGLGAMLDEADRYCRQGRHLLTLATPDDLLVYRRWYLSEIVEQLAGAAPVPWPVYARTADG